MKKIRVPGKDSRVGSDVVGGIEWIASRLRDGHPDYIPFAYNHGEALLIPAGSIGRPHRRQQQPGRVPGRGVGAVGKWPAGATAKSLA